jgi:hypothetical protein
MKIADKIRLAVSLAFVVVVLTRLIMNWFQ